MSSNTNYNNRESASIPNGVFHTANDALYPSLSREAAYESIQQRYPINQQPPSYDEINGSRFGLIRGYHQQMYEPPQQPVQCCDCSGMQHQSNKHDSKCNWGIIIGILLLILGVFALTMGFTLPQKFPSFEERKRLTDEELTDIERIDFYVEVFIITGLTVLSLGGLVVSAGILFPLCRNGRQGYEENYINKYYGSEVYVKRDDITPSQKEIVNFGFHKDVVPSDFSLRKIQPERVSR